MLDVVHWPTISKGDPEAWLYFYEGFPERLRQCAQEKDRLVLHAAGDRYRHGAAGGRGAARRAPLWRRRGLASQNVTLADPAMGTGTFLLGVLQRIADRVEEDQGEGAVPAMIRAALARLIGFEMQFGPFAVAQLRLTAEVLDLLNANTAKPEHVPLRLFLTDTLGNPNEEHEYIPHISRPWPSRGARRTR